MASGLMNSFFPLGTALGVSTFGAVLSARVQAGMTDAALAAAGLPDDVQDPVRVAVAAGRFGELPGLTGGSAEAAELAKTAFANGIATVSLVSLGLALLGGLVAVLTVRNRQLRT